jgi:hypothetical protein
MVLFDSASIQTYKSMFKKKSSLNYLTTMAKFITTIKLEDANEYDYEILNRELKTNFFKPEEHAAKSEAYITGKGSFSLEGNVTIEEVTKAVLKAAAKTGKKFSLFTVKYKMTAI